MANTLQNSSPLPPHLHPDTYYSSSYFLSFLFLFYLLISNAKACLSPYWLLLINLFICAIIISKSQNKCPVHSLYLFFLLLFPIFFLVLFPCLLSSSSSFTSLISHLGSFLTDRTALIIPCFNSLFVPFLFSFLSVLRGSPEVTSLAQSKSCGCSRELDIWRVLPGVNMHYLKLVFSLWPNLLQAEKVYFWCCDGTSLTLTSEIINVPNIGFYKALNCVYVLSR